MATIKEIKEQLANIQRLDDPLLAELEQDSRSGVIQAIAKRKREIQKRIDEDERLEGMLAYEKECYARGMELIAGVDEVGTVQTPCVNGLHPVACICLQNE